MQVSFDIYLRWWNDLREKAAGRPLCCLDQPLLSFHLSSQNHNLSLAHCIQPAVLPTLFLKWLLMKNLTKFHPSLPVGKWWHFDGSQSSVSKNFTKSSTTGEGCLQCFLWTKLTLGLYRSHRSVPLSSLRMGSAKWSVGVRAVSPLPQTRFMYVHVVDVEFHQLVRCWLVVVKTREPIISKVGHVLLEYYSSFWLGWSSERNLRVFESSCHLSTTHGESFALSLSMKRQPTKLSFFYYNWTRVGSESE